MPRDFRRKQILMAALLLTFLVGAFLYVDPWYGAFLFERAWVPVGIFLTGLIGFAVLNLAMRIFNYLEQAWQKRHGRLTGLAAFALLSIAFLFVIHQTYSEYFPYYAYHYNLTINNKIDRNNYRIFSDQPSIVFENENLSSGDSIIYTNEVSLYYYLTHGGLNYGAIYSRALDRNQLNEDLLRGKLANAAYLVSRNPVFDVQSDPEIGITLDDDATLEISALPGTTLETLILFIIHNGLPVNLEIDWHGSDATVTTKQTVTGNIAGWVEFKRPDMEPNQITIRQIGIRPITIRGIRLKQGTDTNWPWQSPATLSFIPSLGDANSIEISQAVLSDGLPIELEVIDDRGFLVLAKIAE